MCIGTWTSSLNVETVRHCPRDTLNSSSVNLTFYGSLIFKRVPHGCVIARFSRVRPTRRRRSWRSLQIFQPPVKRPKVAKVRPRCDNNGEMNFMNGGIVGGATIVLSCVLCLTSTRLELCLWEELGVWSFTNDSLAHAFVFVPSGPSIRLTRLLLSSPLFYHPRVSFVRVSFGT